MLPPDPGDETARTKRFDPRMRMALLAVGVTGAVLTVGALATSGPSAALSVAIGAGLAVGNLWALARIVVALLPDESGRAPRGLGGWAVLGVLKMLGLMGIVWLLMHHGVVSPLPLVVGFGSLPIGIAVGAVLSDRGGA